MSRESFAALGGFWAALQAARLADRLLWGGPAGALFSLGSADGDQLPAHLFHLAFIPAFVWAWARAWRSVGPGPLFWIVNAAATWPLTLFLLYHPAWAVLGLPAAWAVSRLKDRPSCPRLGKAYGQWPLIAVILALYYLWEFPGWSPPFAIDLYHEGDQLGPALDFLAGKAPYRDLFIPHGLIQDLLKTVAAFRLFGISAAAKKLADALCWPLGFLGLAVFARQVLRSPIAWLGLLVALPLTFNYFPDRHFLACLSLAALASGEDKTWLAGGLAGLQVWESLEVGIYACAAGAVFLGLRAPRRRQALTRFAAGAAAFSLPFSAYLAWRGGFGEFLRQSTLRCVSHQGLEGLRYHVLNPGPGMVWRDPLWLWYLPLLLQYGALSLLILRWNTWKKEAVSHGLLVTTAAIFFFYSALARGDFENLSFSAPYSILLGFWLLERAAESPSAAPAFAFAAPLAASLSALLAWGPKLRLKTDAMAENVSTLAGRSVRTYGRMEGVRLEPEHAAVAAKIQELYPPGAPMLPLVGESGLLFVTDRRNLARYYEPDVIINEDAEREIVADLLKAEDPVILTHKDLRRLANRRGVPFRHLRDYLASSCRPEWSSQTYTLWRKLPQGAGQSKRYTSKGSQ